MSSLNLKYCKRCDTTKPVDAFYDFKRWCKECCKEYQREYIKRNKEKRKTYLKEYYERTKEDRKDKIREYQRRYRKEHPEKHQHNNHNRRAREAGAEGSHTIQEFYALCKAFSNRCAYCSVEAPLSADHIVPLSKGGSDNIENIAPACASCNSSKGTKELREWLDI